MALVLSEYALDDRLDFVRVIKNGARARLG